MSWETKKIPLTLEQLEALARSWPELHVMHAIAALAPGAEITLQITSKRKKKKAKK